MEDKNLIRLKKKQAFVQALAKIGTVWPACQVAGINYRQQVYEWRNTDPEFARQMDTAMEAYTDMLERECDRRGCEGFVEPVFFKGEKVGEVKKHSDLLLMFRLKKLRPEYRDTIKIDASPTIIGIFSQEIANRYLRQPESEPQPEPQLLDVTTPQEKE